MSYKEPFQEEYESITKYEKNNIENAQADKTISVAKMIFGLLAAGIVATILGITPITIALLALDGIFVAKQGVTIANANQIVNDKKHIVSKLSAPDNEYLSGNEKHNTYQNYISQKTTKEETKKNEVSFEA